jgi:hypothetical protein
MKYPHLGATTLPNLGAKLHPSAIRNELPKTSPAENKGGWSKMNSQLINELLAFEADHIWISENLETLLAVYPDQWIAVKNGQVLASDPDLAGLLSKLPDPAHTCVEFITREPLEMVL